MTLRKDIMLMAVALSLLSSGPANAGYVSGTDLLGVCAPNKADPVYRLKVAECRGYVVGVADTFDCSNKVMGFTWDSTSQTSQRELVNIVITWLGGHPEFMSYQASGLVAAALSEHFSCGDTPQTSSSSSSSDLKDGAVSSAGDGK